MDGPQKNYGPDIMMFCFGADNRRRCTRSTVGYNATIEFLNFRVRALFYVPLEKSLSVVRFRGNEEVGAGCWMLMVIRLLPCSSLL